MSVLMTTSVILIWSNGYLHLAILLSDPIIHNIETNLMDGTNIHNLQLQRVNDMAIMTKVLWTLTSTRYHIGRPLVILFIVNSKEYINPSTKTLKVFNSSLTCLVPSKYPWLVFLCFWHPYLYGLLKWLWICMMFQQFC